MCTFAQSRFGTTVAGNTSGLPADELWGMVGHPGKMTRDGIQANKEPRTLGHPGRKGHYRGRVEDWRGVPKVWPSLLLPVSVGSASIAEP
jgi:hypothetical protein